MKWKVFSPEEVVSLRNNPYTLKATEKTITFTLKFKEVMLDGLQQGKSPESIMWELGYDPAVIGDSRVKGIAYHITKEAESLEGLHEGRHTPRMARAVTEEEVASSAPSRSLRRLQAEKILSWSCFLDVKAAIDDWMDHYNNDRYQWQLAKLSPNQYYDYVRTGIHPLCK